jgi:hypothetical protein
MTILLFAVLKKYDLKTLSVKVVILEVIPAPGKASPL